MPTPPALNFSTRRSWRSVLIRLVPVVSTAGERAVASPGDVLPFPSDGKTLDA